MLPVPVTAFVGQYGSLALILDEFPNHAEHLAPQNNALSWLMADLFISNGFITMAALLNGFAAFALGAAFWRAAARSLPAAAPLLAAPADVPEGVFSDRSIPRAETGVAG